MDTYSIILQRIGEVSSSSMTDLIVSKIKFSESLLGHGSDMSKMNDKSITLFACNALDRVCIPISPIPFCQTSRVLSFYIKCSIEIQRREPILLYSETTSSLDIAFLHCRFDCIQDVVWLMSIKHQSRLDT